MTDVTDDLRVLRCALPRALHPPLARVEAELERLRKSLREIESLPDRTEAYSVFDTAVSIASDALEGPT